MSAPLKLAMILEFVTDQRDLLSEISKIKIKEPITKCYRFLDFNNKNLISPLYQHKYCPPEDDG